MIPFNSHHTRWFVLALLLMTLLFGCAPQSVVTPTATPAGIPLVVTSTVAPSLPSPSALPSQPAPTLTVAPLATPPVTALRVTPPPFTAADVVVRVNGAMTHQVMLGFGAQHATSWVDDERGDVLGALRPAAIEAAYNQVHLTTGNLSPMMYEGTTTYGQSFNDNDDPFTFNWSGFQTNLMDKAKTLLLDPAKPYGFTDYCLGQRINTRYLNGWLADLRTTDYNRYLDEAAENVVAPFVYYRDQYGIVPACELLFNEPLSGNGELVGSPQDVVDLVKRVGSRLRREGLAVKLVVPNEERVGLSANLAALILADSEARQYVGAIGYHPYPYESLYVNIAKILNTSGKGRPDAGEIALRNRLRDLGKQYGVPVWMTEVCCGGAPTLSFDAFRARAIHIHDEFIYADASAYYPITNIQSSRLGHGGGTDVYADDGAAVVVDDAKQLVLITGMGRAIGHYARWVRRGAVRVEATSSDPLVQVSSFRDDAQKRLVLVVINNGDSTTSLNITVNGLTLGGNLSGEQSTASAYWQPLAAFALNAANRFSISVPAKSVTTIAVQVASFADK